MGLFNNRELMWFGTQDRMQWIETPDTGADVSSLGFSSETTLQSGGGYSRNSWDSHKNFQFSWGESASPELVSTIQGYRNGSFGRGNILFNDPMQYQTNLLPKRWADPSMAVNFEAEPLARGLYPRATPTGSTPTGLPAQTAVYDIPAGLAPGAGDVMVIPVPPGFTVGFGWMGASTGAVSMITASSGMLSLGTFYPTPLPPSSGTLISDTWVAGANGGFLQIALYNPSASVVTASLAGLTVRMAPPGEILKTDGPWMSGEGHSGCQFVGNPTVVNYNGVDGGQLGLSVLLKETGAWA